MIMNLANVLKIAYAASKATELGGYIASGGKANQLSTYAGIAGQVTGALSTVAGATGAKPGDASAQAKIAASTDGRPTQAQLADKGLAPTGTPSQLKAMRNLPGWKDAVGHTTAEQLRIETAKAAKLPTPNTGPATMNTGSTAGKPGFSSKADASGPTAGFDPTIKPKKRYIWTRGIRKRWKKNGES